MDDHDHRMLARPIIFLRYVFVLIVWGLLVRKTIAVEYIILYLLEFRLAVFLTLYNILYLLEFRLAVFLTLPKPLIQYSLIKITHLAQPNICSNIHIFPGSWLSNIFSARSFRSSFVVGIGTMSIERVVEIPNHSKAIWIFDLLPKLLPGRRYCENGSCDGAMESGRDISVGRAEATMLSYIIWKKLVCVRVMSINC